MQKLQHKGSRNAGNICLPNPSHKNYDRGLAKCKHVLPYPRKVNEWFSFKKAKFKKRRFTNYIVIDALIVIASCELL